MFPQSGELLPIGTAGTLITVGFKPTMYSRKHKATLVIQVSCIRNTWKHFVFKLTKIKIISTCHRYQNKTYYIF